jgi:hypothetical protein
VFALVWKLWTSTSGTHSSQQSLFTHYISTLLTYKHLLLYLNLNHYITSILYLIPINSITSTFFLNISLAIIHSQQTTIYQSHTNTIYSHSPISYHFSNNQSQKVIIKITTLKFLSLINHANKPYQQKPRILPVKP